MGSRLTRSRTFVILSTAVPGYCPSRDMAVLLLEAPDVEAAAVVAAASGGSVPLVLMGLWFALELKRAARMD